MPSCRPQRPLLPAGASPEASMTAVSGGGRTGRQPPSTEGPGLKETTWGQFRNRAVAGHLPSREEWERRLTVIPVPYTPCPRTSTAWGHPLTQCHLSPSPRSASPGPPLWRSGPPHLPRPSRSSSAASRTRENKARMGKDPEYVLAPPRPSAHRRASRRTTRRGTRCRLEGERKGGGLGARGGAQA